MDMTRKRYNKPKKARIVVEKCPVDSTGKPCHCHREGQVFEFDLNGAPLISVRRRSTISGRSSGFWNWAGGTPGMKAPM